MTTACYNFKSSWEQFDPCPFGKCHCVQASLAREWPRRWQDPDQHCRGPVRVRQHRCLADIRDRSNTGGSVLSPTGSESAFPGSQTQSLIDQLVRCFVWLLGCLKFLFAIFFFFPSKPATCPWVFEAEDSHPSSPHLSPAIWIGWFDFEGLFAAAPNPRLGLASNECGAGHPVGDRRWSSHVHKLCRDATTFQAMKHLL